jgi:hypothetical protein
MNHTQRIEIVIAGQGLAGTMLGWELWKRDIPFRIFDPGTGNHSSMAAAGMFSLLAARRLKEMELAGPQYKVMKETFGEIGHELGQEFLHEVPTARLMSNEEIPAWKTAAQGEIAHLVKKVHPDFKATGVISGYGAAIIEPSGFIDLPEFLHSVREWMITKHLLINELIDYNSIKTSEDGFMINGHTKTRKVIFCEGPSISNNPFFDYSDIRQNKGEWIEIEAPGFSQDHIIKKEIFILPLRNGRFRVGATFRHGEMDPNPTLDARTELEKKLQSIINVPYQVTDHRAGIRPSSRNRLPVLGPHRNIPGLYIFNGLGSRGVLQAPWYAKILCNEFGAQK